MFANCPNCNNEMYISTRYDTSTCLRCGQVVQSVKYLKSREKSLSEDHFQALRQMRRARLARRAKDRRTEIHALRQALHHDSQLVKAHIRLGLVLPDIKERRKHLMIARRLEPDNMEVLTHLSRLHASLSPEQAAKLFGDEAPVKSAETMATETDVMMCPRCRGEMQSDFTAGELQCTYCGYSEALADEQSVDSRSVFSDVSAQVDEGVRWEIGGRLMQCDNCSAQWTYDTRIATHCPYCRSVQVIVRDAENTFRRPDGLIPFQLDRQQARAHIDERLQHWRERVASLFDPNTVKHVDLTAAYLPFWVFDHLIDIRLQTEFDVVAFKPAQINDPRASSDNYYHLGIPAVRSVPTQLTNQLGSYYRRTMHAYTDGILNHPAEIYDIPLDKAVLRARAMMAKSIGTRVHRESNLKYSTDFSEASYQLLLAPVWLAMLYEVDGDTRPALANGQTGKVVLGRTIKAPSA
jgi:Zn-finger nucleic acid-binding protein